MDGLNTLSHLNYLYFTLSPSRFKRVLRSKERRCRRRVACPFRHRRIPESAERLQVGSPTREEQLWLRDYPSRVSIQSTQTSSEHSTPKKDRKLSATRSRTSDTSQFSSSQTDHFKGKEKEPSPRKKSNTTSAWTFAQSYYSVSLTDINLVPQSEDNFAVNLNEPSQSRALSFESIWEEIRHEECHHCNHKKASDIPAVHRSPHREALLKSVPLKSQTYKYEEEPVLSGWQTINRCGKSNLKHESPPPPAPKTPEKKYKHSVFVRCASSSSLHETYLDKSPRDIYFDSKDDDPFPNFESFPKQVISEFRRRQLSSNSTNYQQDKTSMGRMNPLEDHDRKIIIEFCHLLEKSKQLFNGLRELPQYGHKQWRSYFGRTFDVYTKLWKFQQQHRAILDSKYGLKRWQIGEIASKIGQLYYHFYLRTSETTYLNEAFSFYYAIRGRCYYTKACKEDKCELMVKKLRYYARFIVVCLLLKKIKLVRELIKELDRQIIEYGNTYDPDDQIEWTVVVDEVKAFIQAEPVVSVVHPDNYPIILSHRLNALNTPPVERSPQMTLLLQEVLIVGSSSQQVKFSELTMDMFRMLHTLEREPSENPQHLYDDSPRQRFISTPSAPISKGYNLENGPRRDNPHKYLLFKPSPMQVLVYLSSGCHDLPPNGALLLYISADGQIVHQAKHSEDVGYDIGGLITTSKNDIYRECNRNQVSKAGSTQNKHKELQCLHPGDLSPFTRHPLFIIIDSDNSYVFQHIPRHFGQPLVILMSPVELPSPFHDRRQQGSLFTLFLHSPLTAFCYICDIHNVSLVHWDRAMIFIDTFMAEASQLLTRSRVDLMYIVFMGDDFLRLLILRFIFCEVTLRMHRAFRARTHLTRASPALPDELYEHPGLVHIVMDLAAHLQLRGQFHDPSAGPPPVKE